MNNNLQLDSLFLKEEDLLKLVAPMASILIDNSPQSPLENQKNKRQRIEAKLLNSAREYSACFINAGKLLKLSGFSSQHITEDTSQNISALWNDAVEKSKEGLPLPVLQDLIQMPDQEMISIYEIGAQYLDRNAYSDARDIFLLLVTLNNKISLFWEGLGHCEQGLKNYDVALTAYAYASELDAGNPYIFISAATCLKEQNRLDEAIQVLDSLHNDINDDEKWASLEKQIQTLKTQWAP